LKRTVGFAISLIALALAPGALAADEQGDAGDVAATAQNLTGAGVAMINGRLADGNDADLFRICLSGGGTFSATTEGLTDVDTQLFLFDANGLGIYAHDDGTTRQSTLPAGNAYTPQARGEYIVGISPYDRDPQSAAGPIFGNVAFLTNANGRGAAAPVASWAGLPRDSGAYTIALTGTCSSPSDTTAPVIDLRSPMSGDSVALGATVTVDFSCSDAGGSGLVSCQGSVADGAALDTSTLGPKTVTVTARDGAGNVATASATVEVVDRGAPAIDLRTPADGAGYGVGEEVLADYSCSDEPNGSGVSSCVGDVADGEPLDTSSAGARSFTVTATDAAGNTVSQTVAYEVVGESDFKGFRWPVEDFPAVNRWIAGATVPVRFSLGGYKGRDVLAAGYPQVARVECGAGEEPTSGRPARSASWQKGLRYKHRSYVFMWRTDRDWAGDCLQFIIKLKDGSLHRAEFKFVRSWWGLWPHWDD
jgi:Bacterial pre-peptidase C-terminal domain